jgi:hypothetical protein
MRLWRVLGLLALVAFWMVPAAPAQAGGWAVTLLDPLPDRFEAGHSYTVGYWVLQHGSHPYGGDLGRTGLRLVGPDRQELIFEGVALREAAHYAAAIAVPGEGTWQVFALQGPFAEHTVGTLTVPGAMTIKPPGQPVDVGGHDHGEPAHWGAVHPPGFHHGDGHGGAHAAPAQQPVQQRDVQPAATLAEPRSPMTTALMVFGAVVVLLSLALGVRPLRRRLRG